MNCWLARLRRTKVSPLMRKPTKSQRVEANDANSLRRAAGPLASSRLCGTTSRSCKRADSRFSTNARGRNVARRTGGWRSITSTADKRRLLNTPPDKQRQAQGAVCPNSAFTDAKDQHYVSCEARKPARRRLMRPCMSRFGQMEHDQETFDYALVLLDVVETKADGDQDGDGRCVGDGRGIATTGHVALYGIYFDTDKTVHQAGICSRRCKEIAKADETGSRS